MYHWSALEALIHQGLDNYAKIVTLFVIDVLEEIIISVLSVMMAINWNKRPNVSKRVLKEK